MPTDDPTNRKPARVLSAQLKDLEAVNALYGGALSTPLAAGESTAGEVADAVLRFLELVYPEFRVKYHIGEADITVQFFVPATIVVEDAEQDAQGSVRMVQRVVPLETSLSDAGVKLQRKWETYWLKEFPVVLDEVARECFRADNQRLTAMYVEELASWWFKARGFARGLMPQTLLHTFFDMLRSRLSSPTGA